jgi:hypothetical protein
VSEKDRMMRIEACSLMAGGVKKNGLPYNRLLIRSHE